MKSKRSSALRIVGALLALTLGVVLWLGLGAGPVPGPAQESEDFALARAWDMPGVTCEELFIAAKLGANAWFTHDIHGTLCGSGGDFNGKTLAVTVSGAGYDSLYWDFPYRPDQYSFVRAALRRGLVTFNFDRLGMGRSDRPFGMLLGVDNQAHALQQVIQALKGRYDFRAVVTLGHSFGSTISLAHALAFPDHVDGLILTGFVHNSNPEFGLAMRDGIDVAAFKGPYAGKLFDPSYIISKPNSRRDIFYTAANTDPIVARVDENNRQTTSIGEVITMPKYFQQQSMGLLVPVFTLLGEDDFVVCGGAVECTDHDDIIQWESKYFPQEACHEMVVLEDTNHNANLHRNAADSFQLMLDWIERRAGINGPPAQPCELAYSGENGEGVIPQSAPTPP
jgi:pimeloyl-ACP methyl ester carboxylesterase